MKRFYVSTILIFIGILTLIESKKLSRKKRIVGGHPADPPPAANLNNVAESDNGWGHIEDKPIVFVDDDYQSARIFGSSESKSSDSKKYYAFKGIPYAEPPLNEFRFQRPKRRYLEGDVDASTNGKPCVQPSPKNPKEVIGDEDCLTLNVYTPRIPSSNAANNELLPVIFWIHGGGYRRGSGLQYDPGDLVTKNTIVVTVQYRLGSLGFLSSNQKDLPGNVGLLDISSALYWCRQYIENFGGDPNKITVSGQGSGASAAMLLAQSKLTGDWIQGVVAMSGSAISSFAVDHHPKETYKNVTRKNSICQDKSSVSLVKCLQELSANDIVKADTEIEETNIKGGGFVSGLAELLSPGPVIEGEDDQWSLPNLLDTSAMDSLTSENKTGKIPLLTGVTKQETGSGVKGGFKGDILNTLSNTANFLKDTMPKQILQVNKGLLNNAQLGGVLNKLFSNMDYLGGLSKSLEGVTTELDKVVQMTTDALFNLPMFLTSKVWSLTSEVFVYSFDHKPKKSIASQFLAGLPLIRGSDQVDSPESSHGEDLIYLFDAKTLDGNSPQYQISDSEDIKIRNIFTSLVAEFARTGTPKLPNSNVNWPKFSAQNSEFLSLSSKPKVEKDFRQCQMALWEGLTEILSSQKCSILNLGRLLNTEQGLLGGLTGVNSAGKRVPLLGGKGGLVGGTGNLVGGITNNELLGGLGGNQKNPQQTNQGNTGGLLGLGSTPPKQGNSNSPQQRPTQNQGSTGGLLGLPLLKTNNKENTQNNGQYESSTNSVPNTNKQTGQKKPGGLLGGTSSLLG